MEEPKNHNILNVVAAITFRIQYATVSARILALILADVQTCEREREREREESSLCAGETPC